MFEAVKGWVSNIIAVILFVSIIEIILPEGKMRKYVNLAAGVLIVLIIISPLVRAFNKDLQIEMPEMNLKEPIPLEELKTQGKKIEDMRAKQIVDAYRTKIEKSIEKQVNEIKGVSCQRVVCKVIEDSIKEDFGDIKEITLYVSKKKEEYKNSKIQSVKIELSKSAQNKIEKTVEFPLEIKNEIIKMISYTCRVKPEQIKIINSANR